MKIVSPGQMSEIDSFTINQIGIPSILLMENAAIKVLNEISKDIVSLSNKYICVFSGKGNNGGDALAVARHLYNLGANVKIYLFAYKSEIKRDSKINLEILNNMGIEVIQILSESQIDDVRCQVEKADIVVDGIFGTGLSGEIKGIISDVIKIVNESGKRVISIDIPSGVCGKTGQMNGTCIKADKTVAFALPKLGHFLYPGCGNVGELIIANIGIPKTVVDRFCIKTNISDKNFVSKIIPKRFPNSNKGDYGKVLIIAGSKGMTGAGCLTAKAAIRSGAGIVYLGVPRTLALAVEFAVTEVITIPFCDSGKGSLSKDCLNEILGALSKVKAVAVGPGLSLTEDIFDIVCNIVENSGVPLVLDADALNAISKNVEILKHCKEDIVITPHPGEMARLTGKTVEAIQKDRINTALEFSKKFNVITLLKGANTVIADYNGNVFINPTGNAGMATAGSGDVLTGIIAALIAQGVTPFDAAIAAAYIHGSAGDLAVIQKGQHGLIASDIIEEIPYIIKELDYTEMKL